MEQKEVNLVELIKKEGSNITGTEIEMTKKDGSKIYGLVWNTPNAVGNIIIVTGMEEHSSRYEHFAKFLNEHGFNVYCLDHIGQGFNAKTVADLGIWEPSGFRIMVNTIDELVSKLRVSVRPTYLFGHSMGSFIVQDYIQRFSGHIEKAIICGSNGPDVAVKLGNQLAKILANKKNYNKKTKFFNNLIFGAYARQTPHSKTEFDWLSYNQENVLRYIADPYTGYGSTWGFYREFLKGLNRLYKKKFLNKIRKDLPILMISGAEDPVGHSGKGVQKLKKVYDEYGLTDTQVILYPKMRHEILNEHDHHIVFNDILKFLKK